MARRIGVLGEGAYRSGWLGVLLLSVGLLPLACGSAPSPLPQGQRELVVFAAASLTEALGELGRAFAEAQPGVRVVFNFAGSTQLLAQLEQGAAADLFAPAGREEMERAKAAKLVRLPERVFARNAMTVILPKDNPGQVQRLQDLARPGLRLALAHAAVPAGSYARAVLRRLATDPSFPADFPQRSLANLVTEEANVRGVVAKVMLGEVDAGVVYQSDVTPKTWPHLQVIPIPQALNLAAEYPIATLQSAREGEGAAEFIGFLLSARGQGILRQHGLTPVAEAS